MLKLQKEIIRCKRERLQGVIAITIGISGSTYQKAGTKCFYSKDDHLIGILSGGCVEADVIKHAKQVLLTKKPEKLFYDFRDEGDQLWGLGVGCNGAIDVFLEYYDYEDSLDDLLLEKMLTPKVDIVMVTITDSKNADEIGRKIQIKSNNEQTFDESMEVNQSEVVTSLKKKSTLITIGDREIFIDFVRQFLSFLFSVRGRMLFHKSNRLKTVGGR